MKNNSIIPSGGDNHTYSLTERDRELSSQISEKYNDIYKLNKEYEEWKDLVTRQMPLETSCIITGEDFFTDGILQKIQPHYDCYFPRAFLRSKEGDIILGVDSISKTYKEYLRLYLDWDEVHYLELQPALKNEKSALFLSLLSDFNAHKKILNFFQKEKRDLILHPALGNIYAWESARLLKELGCKNIKVLAPLPKVTSLFNNKDFFCTIIGELLGKDHIIECKIANSVLELFKNIRIMAAYSNRIAVRIPHLGGGVGQVMLTKDDMLLKGSFEKKVFEWMDKIGQIPTEEMPFQITRWEDHVLASPAVNIWIPPEINADPIIEGVFEQWFWPKDPFSFSGSHVSQLPKNLIAKIEHQAYQIACLLKKMHYIGQCGLDAIICGPSLNHASIKFVECNGRWGGSSNTMNFMNRIFGDYSKQPYAARQWQKPKECELEIDELFNLLDDILYQPSKNPHGWAIISGIGFFSFKGVIDLITIGSSYEEAADRHDEFNQIAIKRCHSKYKKAA